MNSLKRLEVILTIHELIHLSWQVHSSLQMINVQPNSFIFQKGLMFSRSVLVSQPNSTISYLVYTRRNPAKCERFCAGM